MPFDADAGKQIGLEAWRIEKMEPVRVKEEDMCKLYSGDCYIILKTYEKYGSIYQDLHFWLGKDSSQDEQGAVAYQTVALDDQLGGKPVQYREVQGHESPAFFSLFPKKLQYLDGGVESGFNHVDRDAYEPRLFQVKGKRKCRVLQVELSSSAMNHGDVFILDKGLELFQWNGAQANKYEKFQGLQMMNDINQERGARAVLHFLENKDENKEFWAVVGPQANVKSAEEGGSDDEAKVETKLIRVSDADGSMSFTEVATGDLSRDQLDTDDVFLVDTGSQVWVWIGKGSNKDERKEAMKFGTDYLKNNGRPDWTPVVRIIETGEPAQFTSLFKDWVKPQSFDPRTTKKEQVEKKVDMSAMLAQQKKVDQAIESYEGVELTIWRIENMQKVLVPESQHGQFHAGDSYIVLFKYVVNNKPRYIIYFWQGRDSTNDEKGASALFAKELDDELGGDPVQVRVVMNKEPDSFIQLFHGKMVVMEGGVASGFKNRDDEDSFDTDGVSLFHVRGTRASNTRAVQVAEKAVSLNSGDCFVLLTPETMYIWEGTGANDDEKAVAAKVAENLKGSRSVETIPEGEEPDAFWEPLGGKTEYASSKSLDEGVIEPRLFQLSTAYHKDKIAVHEIFDFCQDDLVQDDVMLLDAWSEVYIWNGHGANKTEKDEGIKTAYAYLEQTDRKDTPVYTIVAGAEPPTFTCHFLGWDYSKASDFADPLERLKASMTLASLDDVGYSKDKKYSVEELKNNPDGVDPKAKEEYLSDADFQAAFGMGPAAFKALPKWKQAAAKKKVGLF